MPGRRLNPTQCKPGLPFRIEILYTIHSDQKLPAQGHRAVLQGGLEGRHSAEARRKAPQQLFALDNAKTPKDMNAPGWRLHRLHGDLEGLWAVDVGGNWRLTFTFDGEDAVLVDYQDYH